MKYTLVISRGQDGFLIGQIKELPEVFTQGQTVAELKENIADALKMYFEDMREHHQLQGTLIEEEEIVFS
jgi:predicted RNase H-like HicB family nuclease